MLPDNLPTLTNHFFGAGNPLAILFDDSSSGSDTSKDSQDMHDDLNFDNFVNPLEGLRLPRSCMTSAHDGDMLGNNDRENTR